MREQVESLKKHLLEYLKEQSYYTPSKDGYFRCTNPERHAHGDNHPSMRFDPKLNIVHCFSCGATYDLIDLVRRDRSLTTSEAIRWLAQKFNASDVGEKGASKDDQEEGFNLPEGNLEAINYLTSKRGFEHAKELAGAFDLRSDKERIYFPHRSIIQANGGQELRVTDYQAREFNGEGKARYRRPTGAISTLYDYFLALAFPRQGAKPIVITEGEIDALSVFECGLISPELNGLLALGLSSTANAPLLAKALDGIAQDQRGYFRFIVATDSDKPGREASLRVAGILKERGFKFTTKSLLKDGGFKDINERFTKDKSGLIKDLLEEVSNFDDLAATEEQREREEYTSKYSATSQLDGLLADIKEGAYCEPIKTHFERLDALLEGEINKGIVTVGAMSSIGKTSLLVQIADNVARYEKRDVLYFAMEQNAKELIAKSISRLSFQKDPKRAKSVSGVMQGRRYVEYNQSEKDNLFSSMDEYKTFSNRLFYFEPETPRGFTGEEIVKVIKNHIETTKNRPVVVVDYLQIMRAPSEATNERRATDANFLALKSAANEYGLVIFLISSVNRASYYSRVDLNSFKESGGIEFSSDYLLGLDLACLYDDKTEEEIETIDTNAPTSRAQALNDIRKRVEAAKSADPRRLVLSILKNRNGPLEGRDYLTYYPAFNTFIEDKEK